MFRMLEDMNQRMQSDIVNEFTTRERFEEVVLKLLEQTCVKLENSVGFWTLYLLIYILYIEKKNFEKINFIYFNFFSYKIVFLINFFLNYIIYLSSNQL